MPNPTISMPAELKDELDSRRHSTVSRSQYVREALTVRFILEDEGEWEKRVVEASAKGDLAEASPQE